jgi:hypothetical protein
MPLRTPHETTAPGGRRLHLPPLETRLFVRALPWRLRESLLHLLTCAACREALGAELKAPDAAPEALPDARYDEAFERAEEQGRALDEERRRDKLELAELYEGTKAATGTLEGMLGAALVRRHPRRAGRPARGSARSDRVARPPPARGRGSARPSGPHRHGTAATRKRRRPR